MPCSDRGEDEAYNKLWYGEELSTQTILTRTACEAMQVLEDNNLLSFTSPLAQKWWERHKKQDARFNRC